MSAHVDLIRRSRPRFWLYVAGPVLVGLAFGAEAISDLFAPASIALVLYFLFPANVLLYGVNDLFDADVDRENPKKEAREDRYSGGSLTPVAVGISALLAFPLFVLVAPPAIPWLGAFFVLAVAYSAPPLRLKTRPPFDSLSNGLYVLPGVGAYVALAGTLPPLPVLAGAWLWTMAMHTYSAVPDIGPDSRAGIETLATVLGRDRALLYCGACWLFAALAFGAVDYRAGLLLALYPALVLGITLADVTVDRAYWWFPAINAAVGATITVAGLWGIAGA